MATQPGGSVTSRAASETRSGPPGSSSGVAGATGNSSGGNTSSTQTGAKFRHGLLQLMIHTIDPLHDVNTDSTLFVMKLKKKAAKAASTTSLQYQCLKFLKLPTRCPGLLQGEYYRYVVLKKIPIPNDVPGKVDEKATQLHAIASLKVLLDATKPQRGGATTSAANHVKINLKETTLADRPNGNIDTTLDSNIEISPPAVLGLIVGNVIPNTTLNTAGNNDFTPSAFY
uniref:Uncharacterized protein n=1 Tax=Glossina palpalis gambiensis TaxID=67801 RepID=A0A1B0AWZ9_9MUSC